LEDCVLSSFEEEEGALVGPMDGPILEGPIDGPILDGPMDGPLLEGPMDGPIVIVAEGPLVVVVGLPLVLVLVLEGLGPSSSAVAGPAATTTFRFFFL
jgi:hypothetical protein